MSRDNYLCPNAIYRQKLHKEIIFTHIRIAAVEKIEAMNLPEGIENHPEYQWSIRVFNKGRKSDIFDHFTGYYDSQEKRDNDYFRALNLINGI